MSFRDPVNLRAPAALSSVLREYGLFYSILFIFFIFDLFVKMSGKGDDIDGTAKACFILASLMFSRGLSILIRGRFNKKTGKGQVVYLGAPARVLGFSHVFVGMVFLTLSLIKALQPFVYSRDLALLLLGAAIPAHLLIYFLCDRWNETFPRPVLKK